MARITVEDCLQKVNNRFSLIHMASKRVRQLRKGTEPSITSKNRDIVIALREIAAGNITEAEIIHEENMVDDTLDILAEELNEEQSEASLEEEQNADPPEEKQREETVPEGD